MADITDMVKAVKGLAVDFGSATQAAAAGSSGLVDANKSWAPGMHRDRLVRVVDGAGAGQTRVIAGNSENTLVAQTPWARPLDATSVYVILNVGAERLLSDLALILSRLGDPDADVLNSLAAKLGDLQRPLYNVLDDVGRWDAGGSLSLDVIQLLNDVAVTLASVGPANGSALGSLYAILGNPAQDLSAMIGYQGATSLADKLTLARAALLDHLDADVSSRAVPGDQMALTPAEETAIQGQILSDATPFAGADVAAIKAQTDKLPASPAAAGVIESATYLPGLPTTNDLEPATKTIAATVEAVGLGNADYSAVLTLPAPPVAWLEALKISGRLQVNIDSDDGAHDLAGAVYVDAQDAAHRFFDVAYTDIGAQLKVSKATAAVNPTVYNLLKDGQPHTFYFFFWSPGNHSPVISAVQLWEAVGEAQVSGPEGCLKIVHTGLVSIGFWADRVGTGTFCIRGNLNDTPFNTALAWESTQNESLPVKNPMLIDNLVIGTRCSVATDIIYLRDITVNKLAI